MTTLDQREQDADRAAAGRDFVTAARLLAAIVVEAPDRGDSWIKLASVRRTLGDKHGALEAVNGALKRNPLAFVPLLIKASLLDALGESDQAGELYGAAIFQSPSEDRLAPALLAQLAHARERHAAYIKRREAIYAGAMGSLLDRAEPAERKRIERFQSNALRLSKTWHQQPTHFHFPGLPEIEFFERSAFPFLDELDAASRIIREEMDALIASEAAEIVPYVQYGDNVPHPMGKLNWSRDWSALHLLARGERVDANARHCPKTLELFESFDQPHIPGRSPNLMFSLLAPHTRIRPHNGVSNARLVLHLPLVVPPDCGFRVGGETRQWREGEAFVFDDTIEHEAWNDSDLLRVVLIGDIWRPELSPTEREAVTALVTAADKPPSGA